MRTRKEGLVMRFQMSTRLWILNSLAILAAGLVQNSAFAEAAPTKEPAVSERVAQAKNPNEQADKRIKAIDSLKGISEKDVLDNHVIDAMVEVAKNDADPFVRVAAIKTLGTIERDVTHAHTAKTAYLQPFTEILKRNDDYPPVRTAIATVFKETLIATELQDRDIAFKGLVEVVNNKDPKIARDTFGLRLECISAIGSFASAQALDILMSLLNDSDPIIKETVAKAIFDCLNKTTESADKVTFATVKKLVDIMEDSKAPVDLRIGVMFALAKLIRAGSLEAAKAFPSIVNLRKTTPDNAEGNLLVLNSIEAMGIIGSAESVDAIKNIYETYYDKGLVSDVKRLPFRRAAMKAFESVLKTQGVRKQQDPGAVTTIAKTFERVIDNNKDTWPEAPEVRIDAIFAVRYFIYKPFEKEQQFVYGALIDILNSDSKQHPDNTDDIKAKVIETLDAVTQLGPVFKGETRRWREWYAAKYPATPEKK
jgi:hypothetical protein